MREIEEKDIEREREKSKEAKGSLLKRMGRI